MAILSIRNLVIDYPINIGTVRAVDGVSIDLEKGETLGLVGESGCGKSTLGLSILNLLRPPGRITSGSISFDRTDIVTMTRRELLQMRGRDIAMVFQNPLTSLNPLYRIDRQFYETIRRHEPNIKKKEAIERIASVLDSLGIERARMNDYPHQLSGGMRQRIMIGLGLILNPDIVIADEPTTSLDVIVEAGFIDLLARLKRNFNLSVILITHNLGLVAQLANRVAVMYAGKLVEIGEADQIFKEPLHPYTKGLICCVPNIKLDQEQLEIMDGNPPDLVDPPSGCRFSPRCPEVMDRCRIEAPVMATFDKKTSAACWLYNTVATT